MVITCALPPLRAAPLGPLLAVALLLHGCMATLNEGSEPENCGDDDATSQGPSRLHFGLGELDLIPFIRVQWPDGEVTEGHDLGTRRLVTEVHSGATQ